MFDRLISFLSTADLSPHSVCLLGRDDIISLQIIADTITAISYFSISVAILYFAQRRRDLHFKWIFILFGAFIVTCGTTHVFSVLTFWLPIYGVETLLKLVTAALSLTTAIVLWPLMPKALAIPSRADLEIRIAERTRELVEAREAAESASKAKSEFLAMMSHELRTPLNTIIGFAEVMSNRELGQKLSDKFPEYATDIYDSGTHLLAMINDILDISKIDAKKLEIERQNIDINDIMVMMSRLLALRLIKAGLVMTHDIDSDARYICADERALKQILFNLITNAIKFTKRDGHIAVTVKSCNAHDIQISVSDTGIGIPSDQIARLGRPFEMLDNRYSQSGTGTGLGLALVRGLVALHQGTMSIESVVGQGTTVSIALPRHVQTEAASRP